MPLHGGPNGTLIAALTPHGPEALLSVDGGVNGDVSAAYFDQVLGPTLRPGNVTVFDNLSVHQVDGPDDIVKKYGARLRYLPPYSPDFIPIDPAFSKLKTWLRTAQARTLDRLKVAIVAAAAWITAPVAKDQFDHCEYHVQKLRNRAKQAFIVFPGSALSPSGEVVMDRVPAGKLAG